MSCADVFLHTAATHRQTELDGVDGLVERPGKLVLPQGLHHHILHVLQLVGLPAGQKHTGHVTKLTASHDNVAAAAWSLTKLQVCWGAGSYLPGLVGLVTSGGGGLVRGGGLGGAASGASDMVDDGDKAMHCGTAVSGLKVKKKTTPPAV